MVVMSEKQCFKCSKVKPLGEFYKHKAMADGRVNKCKECTKGDVAKHRSDNLEKIREYDRNRAKLPHRVALNKRITKEWRAANPLGYKAHSAVSNALKAGRLEKPTECSICNAPHDQIEGHHIDYSKPLEVTWCCPACHWLLDQERRVMEAQ